ncbi:hypothetical protein NQZ68_019861 [Dissostichus eleginoides]|nr:hypothetical protein NQZ68_019861 [Dissostichus eleginoides]
MVELFSADHRLRCITQPEQHYTAPVSPLASLAVTTGRHGGAAEFSQAQPRRGDAKPAKEVEYKIKLAQDLTDFLYQRSPGQSSQECCLALTLRKDPFRDPGPPSGHTLFLFQRSQRTHKSKTPNAPPIICDIYLDGQALVEDVVVHQPPPGTIIPGHGEKGGGWDTN